MIDGPETVQHTLIMLQTKTQIKQIYTERSLTKMDARSTAYRGKTKEQPTEYLRIYRSWASKKILDEYMLLIFMACYI